MNHIEGLLDVRGRDSQNNLIHRELRWDFQTKLTQGLERTFGLIRSQIVGTGFRDE